MAWVHWTSAHKSALTRAAVLAAGMAVKTAVSRAFLKADALVVATDGWSAVWLAGWSAVRLAVWMADLLAFH
jgi:hypothetical protein